MMGTRQLMDEYLGRLEQAAQVLPPGQRTELIAEIRGHIDDAGVDSEAGLREVLDRLGPPEEIVAAAREDEQPAWTASAAAAPTPRRSILLETGAVLMLTVGSIVLPVIGWLVGVVLLWSSDRWRTREKVLGTLVIPGGIGIYLLSFAFLSGSQSCFESAATTVDGSPVPDSTSSTCESAGSWTDVLVPGAIVVSLIAGLVVPFVLLHLARRRASAEPEAPVATRPVQPIS